MSPRPRAALVLVALLLTVPLTGCTQAPQPSDGWTVSTADEDRLLIAARPSTDRLRPGDLLTVELALVNQGATAVTVDETCGGPWGVEVLDPGGRAMPLPELSSPACPSVIEERRLWPTTSMTGTFRWDATVPRQDGTTGTDPVPGGTYTLVITAHTLEGPIDRHVTLRVHVTDAPGANPLPGPEAGPAPEPEPEPEPTPGPEPEPEPTPSYGNRSAPTRDHLVVSAMLQPTDRIQPGEDLMVHARFMNEGDNTTQVPQGCGEPWRMRVYDADKGTLRHARPMGSCLGFTVVDMHPGGYMETTFTWNGTVWEDDPDHPDGGTYEAAPEGTYIISVSARSAATDDSTEVRLPVHVLA